METKLRIDSWLIGEGLIVDENPYSDDRHYSMVRWFDSDRITHALNGLESRFTYLIRERR